MLSLTVLILSGGRVDALSSCLESVAAADLPEDTEVVIALNGSQPDVEELVRGYPVELPGLRTIEVPFSNPGAARDAAVGCVEGSVIHFLDDDVMVERDTFTRALEALRQDEGVLVVGGPNLTPTGSTLFQRCVGMFLGSTIGTWPVTRRYSRRPSQWVNERSLILCNLAVRKGVLEEIPFDPTLTCGEENLFMRRVAERGRMLYDPDVSVLHERRRTFREHLRQMAKYGRGRAEVMRRKPMLSMVVFLVPSALTGYLLCLAVTATVDPGWIGARPAVAVPALAYLAATAIASIWAAARLRDLRAFAITWALIVGAHIAYGSALVTFLVWKPRASIDSAYWDGVASLDWLPAGWWRHVKAAHLHLCRRWHAGESGTWLKTDLFEERSDRALLSDLPGRWVGVDLSEKVAVRARSRVAAVAVSDVRRLPFASGSFDGILSTSTLDHFHDRSGLRDSLHELFRVLAPGGALILTLDNPSNPLIRLRNAMPSRLGRATGMVPFFVGQTLSEQQGCQALTEAGFVVDEVDYLIHAPHIVSSRLARFGWFERRVLPRLDSAARSIACRRTGHFVAFHCRVPVEAAAPVGHPEAMWLPRTVAVG